MTKNIINSQDVARYCGVSHETVARWIEKGLLCAHPLDNKHEWLIELGNFLAFLRSSRLIIKQDFRHGEHRALIVDDEEKMSHSINRQLGMAEFTTMIAHDAFHAGVLLGSFCPTVLTLDIRMPMVSGFEIVKFVRASTFLRHTKILMISGLAVQELHIALKAGADDILQKPFTNAALVEKAMTLSVQSILEAEADDQHSRGAHVESAVLSSGVLCAF